MRILAIDTEFNTKDMGRTGLVSIALVTDLASYYAVNADMDIQKIGEDPEIGPWMTDNVFSHIPNYGMRRLQHTPDVKPYDVIGHEINEFLRMCCDVTGTELDIRTVAACGGQDIVRMQNTISHSWADFGPWVPLHIDDMRRIKRDAVAAGADLGGLPVQHEEERHHALYDAEHELVTVTEIHRILKEL